jgi:uncharacterized membrane protein
MEEINDILFFVMVGIMLAGIILLWVALIKSVKELKILNKISDSRKIDSAEKRKD